MPDPAHRPRATWNGVRVGTLAQNPDAPDALPGRGTVPPLPPSSPRSPGLGHDNGHDGTTGTVAQPNPAPEPSNAPLARRLQDRRRHLRARLWARSIRTLLDLAQPAVPWPTLAQQSRMSGLVEDLRATSAFAARNAFRHANGPDLAAIDTVKIVGAIGAANAAEFAHIVKVLIEAPDEEHTPEIVALLDEAVRRGWLTPAD